MGMLDESVELSVNRGESDLAVFRSLQWFADASKSCVSVALTEVWIVSAVC